MMLCSGNQFGLASKACPSPNVEDSPCAVLTEVRQPTLCDEVGRNVGV